MKKTLRIYNDVIRDKTLSSAEITLIAALNGIITPDEKLVINSPRWLEYSVFDREANRRECDLMKKSLQNLINKGIVFDAKRRNVPYIDAGNLIVGNKNNKSNKEPRYFTTIDRADYYKIMNNEDINCFTAMHVYLTILSYIRRDFGEKSEYNGCISIVGLETISMCTNLNIKTVMKYIDFLKKNNIICSRTAVFKNSIGSGMPQNIYAKCEDEEVLNEYVDCVIGESKKHKTANKNRSLKQKYNRLLKGEFAGTQSDFKEIQKYVEDYNDKVMLGEINGDYLDTSVFDEFDL